MPSALETVIQAQRAALLRGDEIALRTMVRAYGPVRRNRIDLIVELVDQATSAGVATPGQLLRLERAQVLLGQVKDELRRFGGSASRFVANGQSQAVQLALRHAEEMVQLQGVNIATGFNKLNRAAVSDLVGRLSNGQSLGQYFDKLAVTTRQQISDALIDGVARGINPRAVADALAKKLDIAGEKLLTVTRTEMLSAYRSASSRNYQANADILSGVMWLASMSVSTCAACLSRSGTIFAVDYRMETHSRCRCTLIPIVKGSDAPQLQSGESFLSGRDESEQNRMLGGSDAGQAYRDGKVILSDFVRLNKNDEWGDSVTRDSLTGALQRAEKRARHAA